MRNGVQGHLAAIALIAQGGLGKFIAQSPYRGGLVEDIGLFCKALDTILGQNLDMGHGFGAFDIPQVPVEVKGFGDGLVADGVGVKVEALVGRSSGDRHHMVIVQDFDALAGVVAEVFKHEGGIVLQGAVLKKLQGGGAHSVRGVLVANGGHFGHEFIDRDRVSVDKGGENADVGVCLAESVDGFLLVSDEQARVIVRGVAIGAQNRPGKDRKTGFDGLARG